MKPLGWITTALGTVAFSLTQAMAMPQIEPSITACHTPNGQIDDTVTALAQDGWTQLPAGEMPADIADLLIWPQIVFYTTGDTGGADLTSLADIQRKSVAGFARKKDIPQSKTRILIRDKSGQTEAALVLWQQPVPHQTIVICRLALSAGTVPAHAQAPFGLPQVTDTSDATTKRTATLTPMNPDALSAQIGSPVTTTATLQTQITFPTQE